MRQQVVAQGGQAVSGPVLMLGQPGIAQVAESLRQDAGGHARYPGRQFAVGQPAWLELSRIRHQQARAPTSSRPK